MWYMSSVLTFTLENLLWASFCHRCKGLDIGDNWMFKVSVGFMVKVKNLISVGR